MTRAKIIFLPIFIFSFTLLVTCGGGGGIDKKKDSDGDGMPDWWEITYGLNPNDPADASQDSDNDGWTNLEEYQNGTDPRVADPPKELCNGLDDDGNGLIDEVWLDKGKPCGMCGTYQCSADGLSLECPGQGVCTPGANKICGSNGMKTCLDTCAWGECFEPLQCTVGEQQTSPCGYCQEGALTRTCDINGLWGIWSDCLGRGCQPAAAQACEVEGTPGTQDCSNECKWSDCAATCNPGDKFTASCGDCGTYNRTCRTDGTWSGFTACQCADQIETKDFPGYAGQTRTCGEATLCKWTPWANCTLAGAECQSEDIQTQACGCGGTGRETRTCSEVCVWDDWSDCQGDLDGTPPSVPELLAPADRSTFYALPITFSWLPSTDNCGLSNTRAYEIMLENSDQVYAQPITVETGSTSYELLSLPSGSWRWWVRAEDTSGNYSDWSVGRSLTYHSTVVVFQETFEAITLSSSWTVGDASPPGGEDYWGLSAARSASGSSALWCAAVGTQSDDECKAVGSSNPSAHRYDNNMAAFLETLLDLSGYSHLTLSFWYWLEVADKNDCLKVRVKDQAGTWTEAWTKCDNSKGWTYSHLDFSGYDGQASVTLQFRFESDSSSHCAEGAYLDDVILEGW